MASGPNDHHEPIHAGAAHEVPEAQTVEQRIGEERERRIRRRTVAAGIIILLGLVLSHVIVHIPNFGAWAALAVIIVASLCASVLRRSTGIPSSTSPLRGIFLLWLAISVAMVVLVSLDRFSLENMLLLAVVWGGLLLLWLGDRALARLLRQPKSS
jgi:hypothetical protein